MEIKYQEADDGFALHVEDDKYNYTITIVNDVMNKSGQFEVSYDNKFNEMSKEIESDAKTLLESIIEKSTGIEQAIQD